MQKLKNLFSADLRSLGALRIGVAAMVILTLLLDAPYINTFYTDGGVLPRFAVGYVTHSYLLSLQMLNGSYYFQVGAFLITILSACVLLAGYKTRLFTVLTFILLISVQNRNVLIIDGGDVTLKILLFWGIFIPWGARFSLDSRRKELKNLPNKVFTFGIVGYFLQIAFIYFFASIAKSGLAWTKTYEALYYILSVDMFSSPLGRALSSYPAFLKINTFLVKWLEFAAPFLLFFPYKNSIVRFLSIILLVVMHLGIGLLMNIGLFPYISMVALIGLLPSFFWDDVLKIKSSLSIGKSSLPWDFSIPLNILAVLFISVIFVWNVLIVYQTIIPNKIFDNAIYLIGINQSWHFFAPGPATGDYWYEVWGVTNESRTNLVEKTSPIYFGQADGYSSALTRRWRNFLASFLRTRFQQDEEGLLGLYYCSQTDYDNIMVNKMYRKSGKAYPELRKSLIHSCGSDQIFK